ncbi:MAG: toprim domain-containing protein [Ignavibacteriae bacterium]|nr:toprim domain-containing protein [Ignavibacteriota bacterium]
MAKNTIDRIKREVCLVKIVEQAGVALKKQGQDMIGRCPFHQEETPSFHVTPEKRLWHCFGCGKGGSVIDFVMEMKGWDIQQTVESLSECPKTQQSKQITEKETSMSDSLDTSGKPFTPESLTEEVEFRKALRSVIHYYHQTLLETPSALAYLQGRGLNHPEMLDAFQIGYSNRTLSKITPANERGKKNRIREFLKHRGILKERGSEHFDSYLTFPIYKTDGVLGEIYGRRVHSKDGCPDHLYLPGPHQGIFNFNAIGLDQPLILCESVIDALTFWVQGFRHVTASFGVNGFTDELREYCQRQGVKRIDLAYDNDEAGNNAANKLAPELMESGFEVFRLLLPKGKDVNQFALAVPDPKTAFQELMAQRQAYQPSVVHGKTSRSSSLAGDSLAGKSALQWRGQDAETTYGNRSYRLRGLEKISALDHLKIQIRVTLNQAFFMDTLDLVSNRQRQNFIKEAAKELECEESVIKRDIGKLLLEVETFAEQTLSRKETADKKAAVTSMSEEEQTEALNFLKDLNLLDQLFKDFETIGIVGEETNKLVGYLASVSRKLDDPLAVLIQSSSSAGKTTLMDGVLALTPPEEYQRWTTITEQALYYAEETQLAHKVLAISEEEGTEKADYALKNLISDKFLKIATTIKDPSSGEFKMQEKRVEGPSAMLVTTTAAEINEELLNRFIRLTVEESREQTALIHQKQRHSKTLEGLKAKKAKENVKKKHHNAQRLLRPLTIVNPYESQLTFMTDYLRNRRDNAKYLSLIEAVTFLHQYQRPLKQVEIEGRGIEYIEVTPEDIAVANRLASEVFGRCLDELAPQTRRLLELLDEMVQEIMNADGLDQGEILFTRRHIRERLLWSDTQLQIHLKRLETLEYLHCHQGGRGQSFLYELLWSGEGKDGSKFILKLADPSTLQKTEPL